MTIVRLMNSPAGRAARVAAGLALIVAGTAIGGAGGLALALVGVVPVVAGAAAACLAARLMRVPLRAR